ncbi:heavy metal-associated domain-containing protein [Clostridium sp. D53t1_180928_C8]|uniref:heavy-metal-associated domain-containing protein n=1 Tax=Clostridium sp. D53t1_180928_C8 TaxID=2787101 RepID=UPI0018AB90F2|nr:heavy metal-associated domain-containing protein [Clostridium sp. D53t1_180928_C8]
MKSLVRIYNLTNHKDIIKIKNLVSNYEGILACEINLNKKEVNLVYDRLSIAIDEIIASIENSGYMVI